MLTLDERGAALRALAPGEASGYGRRVLADAPLRVALVPVGYADGYPRPAAGAGQVVVARPAAARSAPWRWTSSR